MRPLVCTRPAPGGVPGVRFCETPAPPHGRRGLKFSQVHAPLRARADCLFLLAVAPPSTIGLPSARGPVFTSLVFSDQVNETGPAPAEEGVSGQDAVRQPQLRQFLGRPSLARDRHLVRHRRVPPSDRRASVTGGTHRSSQLHQRCTSQYSFSPPKAAGVCGTAPAGGPRTLSKRVRSGLAAPAPVLLRADRGEAGRSERRRRGQPTWRPRPGQP